MSSEVVNGRANWRNEREIHFGYARIVYNKEDKFWALPGGRKTTDEREARDEAERIDRVIRSHQ
jgi:hypothetical protein